MTDPSEPQNGRRGVPLHRIEPEEWTTRPFQVLHEQWALLVGGDEHPNPMTISWGGFGTLWELPIVTVFVRPVRHTWGLLNASPFFTVNFMPEPFHRALEICGEISGRDVDKWAAAGIHPLGGGTVPVPRVAEARTAIECRILAHLDLDPARFLDPAIDRHYPQADYHRAFLGEVLAVWTR